MKLTESHLRQMIRQELKKAMGLNEYNATKEDEDFEARRLAALTDTERNTEAFERRRRAALTPAERQAEDREAEINMRAYGTRDGNRYVK